MVSTTDVSNGCRRRAVAGLAGCTQCGRPGVLRRGRCGGCYEAHRRKQVILGVWDARRTPLGPVVAHINDLLDAGLSQARIAQLAGTSDDWIRKLRRPGRKWVEPPVADAVLAIPIPAAAHHLMAGQSRVDATGTRRRLQALSAIGYSQEDLIGRLGMAAAWAHCLWSDQKLLVAAATAARVEALYNELSMTPGTASRARLWAVRRGYPPPLAWDDDAIDDPGARPCPPVGVVRPISCAGRRAVPTNFADVVNDHRALGRTDDDIADRLGLKLDTLQSRLRRIEEKAS